MGNRTAKFISTLIASMIAGVPLAAVSQNAPSAPPAANNTANAASDCLASPKGAAPQGQHWYYRLERSTKRQCWYLRAEAAKDSIKDGAKAVQTAQAAPDASAAEQAAPPPQHSVKDARAEYLTPKSTAAPAATTAQVAAVAPAPAQQPASPAADANAQQPAVATRWPDAMAASPAPQAAPAPVAVAAAQPGAKPSKSPVALAAADASSDKPTGSLQTLILVVGGALALAGLLASIIYRFAGGRSRAKDGAKDRVKADDHHRRVNWDHHEPHDHDDGRAPWLNDVPAKALRAQQRGPIDFDAQRPARPPAPQIAAFSNEIGRIAALSRSTHNEVAELDETDIFDGEFEVVAAAPRLAAGDAPDEATVDAEPVDEAPADRRKEDVQDVQIEGTVDVDVITAMLERLAQQGPRLAQPSPEADLADPARSSRGQSAARA